MLEGEGKGKRVGNRGLLRGICGLRGRRCVGGKEGWGKEGWTRQGWILRS